jgi:hypothetical protein
MLAPPRAPYSLEPTLFSFPALAMLAGRAPLGGPREVALGCFLVGRIVRDCILSHQGFSLEQVEHRAAAAKHWLGSVAIQASVRIALGRLIDACAAHDASAVRSALDGVIAVTANTLDQGARLELGRLSQIIAA